MTSVTNVVLVFAAALMTIPTQAQAAGSETILHCNGTTWRSVGVTGELPTDALVRIDSNGTYIAISGVGSGQSDKPPRAVTTVESVGSLQLRSAAQGQPPAEAWFNINRYSGDLTVAPTGSGGKTFFLGKCKKAEPLF